MDYIIIIYLIYAAHRFLRAIAICLLVVVMLLITAPIAVPVNRYRALLDQCHNVSLSVAHISQSGVYTIVGILSGVNLICYKPFANVDLRSQERNNNFNISLYIITQNNLEKAPLFFNNTKNKCYLGNITAGYTQRIFDTYYAQNCFNVKNYFLDANVTLDIDVSCGFLSSELFVCFFSDDSVYDEFLDSNETFWRSTNNCRSTTLKGSERCNVSETFVVDQPSYWYIGIATSATVDVHHVWLRGIAYNISSITQKSTQPTVCSVESSISRKSIKQNGRCIIPILDKKPVNQDLYIVAYEEEDQHRNYLTAINIMLDKMDFNHPVQMYTIGVVITDPIIFVVVMLVALFPYIKARCQVQQTLSSPVQATCTDGEQRQNSENDQEQREGSTNRENHPITSRHRQTEQIVQQDNESHNVEQGNSGEPQTSKTVETYSTNLSFAVGISEASINNE